MNAKKIKRFKKSIEYLRDPKHYNRAINMFKRIKAAIWLRHSIPNKPMIVSKKRHGGESFADFRVRRKKCNQRRRDRETMRKRTYIIMKTMQHVKAV
jgi:hypothetical protein